MRSIAERLAYNRRYSPELNPKIFSEDMEMHPEVRDKILEIVDEFLEYTQIDDIHILDVRVVGSNASYNYNENSDLDVHIVVDLSEISKPETIANLYFGEVKHAFKEAYDIQIRGIDVELYVEDVNASPTTNGIYSVTQDKWIKEPTPMEDPSDDDFAKAEEIEDEIMSEIEANQDNEDALNAVIDKIYLMRKDGLASEGETSPANLAFKSLRNKGILTRAKDELKDKVSKRLSLEGKEIRENNSYENVEDVVDLITYIRNKCLPSIEDKELDMTLSSSDGYEFNWWWGSNSDYPQGYPICQIDYNGITIFNREGYATNPKDLLDRAIRKIKQHAVVKLI